MSGATAFQTGMLSSNAEQHHLGHLFPWRQVLVEVTVGKWRSVAVLCRAVPFCAVTCCAVPCGAGGELLAAGLPDSHVYKAFNIVGTTVMAAVEDMGYPVQM
jgi:hypothetical protein